MPSIIDEIEAIIQSFFKEAKRKAEASARDYDSGTVVSGRRRLHNWELTIPAVPYQAAVPEQPYVPAVPEIPYRAATPAVPYQAAVPEQPYVPAVPEIPYRAAIPERPYQAAVPEQPYVAAVPEIPYRAAIPEVPYQAAVPEQPYVPAVPEIPYRAAIPEVPYQAAQPEHPTEAETAAYNQLVIDHNLAVNQYNTDLAIVQAHNALPPVEIYSDDPQFKEDYPSHIPYDAASGILLTAQRLRHWLRHVKSTNSTTVYNYITEDLAVEYYLPEWNYGTGQIRDLFVDFMTFRFRDTPDRNKWDSYLPLFTNFPSDLSRTSYPAPASMNGANFPVGFFVNRPNDGFTQYHTHGFFFDEFFYWRKLVSVGIGKPENFYDNYTTITPKRNLPSSKLIKPLSLFNRDYGDYNAFTRHGFPYVDFISLFNPAQSHLWYYKQYEISPAQPTVQSVSDHFGTLVSLFNGSTWTGQSGWQVSYNLFQTYIGTANPYWSGLVTSQDDNLPLPEEPDPLPPPPTFIPAIPEVPYQAAVPEQPYVPAVPEIPYRAAIPEVPYQAAVPEQPYVPAVPEIPYRAAIPEVSYQAAVPEQPYVPAVPEIPYRAAIPEIPYQAAVPEQLYVPAVPEIPYRAAIPEVPYVPATYTCNIHNHTIQI
jgi:hypothetical protein